jgi:hypothetical protein
MKSNRKNVALYVRTARIRTTSVNILIITRDIQSSSFLLHYNISACKHEHSQTHEQNAVTKITHSCLSSFTHLFSPHLLLHFQPCLLLTSYLSSFLYSRPFFYSCLLPMSLSISFHSPIFWCPRILLLKS